MPYLLQECRFSQTRGFKMVFHESVGDIMVLMEYGKENTFVQ